MIKPADLLGGIFFTVFGVTSLLSFKYFGEKAALFQKRFFGSYGRSIKFNQIGYFFGGIVFIIVGILLLLGKLKTR